MVSTIGVIKEEVRRLLCDLVQTAHASSTGDGVTLSYPLPDQNIVGKTVVLPPTELLAEPRIVTDDIINPPWTQPVYVVGNNVGIESPVLIVGEDFQGDVVGVGVTPDGTNPVASSIAFRTIRRIELPSFDTNPSDTITIYTPHSVTCTVDGALKTDFIVEFDSGVVTFETPPASGGEILWAYRYTQFNERDLMSALNNAIAYILVEVPAVITDTTTVVPSENTYEYRLPDNCLRLVRVESRSSGVSPYMLVPKWRVIEGSDGRYLKFIAPPSSGDTIRIHYVTQPRTVTSDTDTLRDVGLPERAKWAVMYLTCFYLCEQKLLPRARTNQFKNAEGVNVPKVFEIQRIAADFKALADIEIRKLRIGAKRWS